MRKLPLALLSLALLMMVCGQKMPAGFSVNGYLRDGTKVAGTIQEDHIDLVVERISGEKAPVRIGKNPDWAQTSIVLELNWSTKQRQYVIRTFSWTAEAAALHGTIVLNLAEGRAVAVDAGKLARLLVNQQGVKE